MESDITKAEIEQRARDIEQAMEGLSFDVIRNIALSIFRDIILEAAVQHGEDPHYAWDDFKLQIGTWFVKYEESKKQKEPHNA